MKEIKISVIMPVYNTEKYVWEAIESILNQSFKYFEFIIIDDCSTDNSYNICKEYAKKDGRIKLYKNKKNMWISYTRNKLISLTNTNYIASQDSDDISLKDRLKLSYEFLEKNNDFWVVSWNNIIINEDWNKIWERIYSNNIEKTILKKSPISQPSSIFRKDIFLEVWWYDKHLNYWEDYDLWCKIFAKWYKIKNLDNFLIKLRIRKWQTKSSKLKQTIKNTILIQKKAENKYWIKASFWDRIYRFLEYLLLLLPSSLIIYLFKKIEYRWKKKLHYEY
jgi:glycosyltransferase involved in cell wall biosynthesis